MTLGALDYIVLLVYALAILAIGFWFGREERSTEDFFLGGRKQPWLIVGLSIIATEVSALTFVAVPAESFGSDWSYLQMYAGAFAGRIVVILLLLPAFYEARVTTVYEYLGKRFGPKTRTFGAMLFVASRVIGSGVRLLAASIAIRAVFGVTVETAILATAAAAALYTSFGGIKAIIWTDAAQAVVFLLAGIAAVWFLFAQTPGDAASVVATARDAGKLTVFNWSLDLNDDTAFFVLLIHATFLNTAALGVDQDLTQRMLTCKDAKSGQRSLLFNALFGFPVVCLFLLLGTMLFVYYASPGSTALPENFENKNIFPHFIATAMPKGSGLRGLMIAGMFSAALSSLDSALGALSSTIVNDFVKPLRTRLGAVGDETRDVGLARIVTLAVGAALAGTALAFRNNSELLWTTFRWVGLVFGAMLGIFLLGLLTKTRGRDNWNLFAMASSVALLVIIMAMQNHFAQVVIAWPWWIVIGTTWTFVLGAIFPTRQSDREQAQA